MTTIARYCVYFRVTSTETRIIRFLHGSRDVSQISFAANNDEPRDNE